MPINEKGVRFVPQLPEGISASRPRLRSGPGFEDPLFPDANTHLVFTLKNTDTHAMKNLAVWIYYLDADGEIIDSDGDVYDDVLEPQATKQISFPASDYDAVTYTLITVEATRDNVLQSIKLYAFLLLLFFLIMHWII